MSEAGFSREIRAILLDIEGTTTPIDFVLGTLFPYASKHVEEFLFAHAEEEEVQSLIVELQKFHDADKKKADDVPLWDVSSRTSQRRSAANYVRRLIARDSKITPLKSLQGKIWEEGYRRGDLKGEVYADVPQAFRRWREQGRRIAIFSSGSVLAQQLLFSHTGAGDLSGLIEAYFDTTTGPKRAQESYRKIAAALRLATTEILFVSDVEAELDAAGSAGMATALSLRPKIAAPNVHTHAEIRTFAGIFPTP